MKTLNIIFLVLCLVQLACLLSISFPDGEFLTAAIAFLLPTLAGIIVTTKNLLTKF